MRVAFVIESLGRGGAERLLATTVAGLDRSRVEPRVVMLGGADALAPEFAALDAPVHDLGMDGVRALPRTVRRLRRLLRNHDVDVVHSHLYFANQAARLATMGARVGLVTTLHNPDYTHEAHAGLRFRGRKALERATLRLRPGRLLAVSEAVRADYVRHFDLPPVEVLPNYMDVGAFQSRVAAVDRPSARAETGAGGDEVVALHVGRFHPQKGHDVLIRSFARARTEVPRLRLVLVGQGDLRPEIEELVAAEGVEGAVHFAGAVDDPAPFYAAADLFVFPSRYEAFGIALLEALAAGLPALASRTGGIVDVVSDACARLVPPEDEPALTRALVDLAADATGRARMGAAARARAARFDVAAHLPRLEAIYAGA